MIYNNIKIDTIKRNKNDNNETYTFEKTFTKNCDVIYYLCRKKYLLWIVTIKLGETTNHRTTYSVLICGLSYVLGGEIHAQNSPNL